MHFWFKRFFTPLLNLHSMNSHRLKVNITSFISVLTFWQWIFFFQILAHFI